MLRGLANENGPVRLFHPVKVRVDARNSGANVLGLFKREHTVLIVANVSQALDVIVFTGVKSRHDGPNNVG